MNNTDKDQNMAVKCQQSQKKLTILLKINITSTIQKINEHCTLSKRSMKQSFQGKKQGLHTKEN